MSAKQLDLTALRRTGEAATHRTNGGTTAVAPDIPMPQRKWKTRIVLPALIIGGALLLLAVAARDSLLPASPVHVIPAMVKAGVTGGGTVTVLAPGWVEADPYSHAVSALADGVVEDVLVLEGQPIEAGRVVAQLVDEDARLALDRMQAELAARQAELLAAKAAQAAARRDWDHPIERERALATSEAMLAERKTQLAQWPAELAAAEARAAELKAEYERLIPLREDGQANEIEFIRADKQYAAQVATVELTRQREGILKAEIARMEAEVRAARENLELRIPEQLALDDAEAGVRRAEAAIRQAEAAVAEAKLRLDRMQVRSPVSGIVMNRLVEPGSKVMLNSDMPRSAQIVRVYQPDKLQVRADVPLVDAAHVGVGQQARVIVDVLPDRVFEGVVTRIVHEADIQKNTLQVKVAIKNPSPELKPEMIARAKFLAAERAELNPDDARIFIPEALIEQEGTVHRVWVGNLATGLAERREVSLGSARVGGWVEVTSGISPGDRIIVDPPANLSEGDRIRVAGEAADRFTESKGGH